MNQIEIENERDGSVFVVAIDGGAVSVSAQDDADASIAKLAKARVDEAMRDGYTPAMGEPLAFAASVAANVLRGKVKTQIPPGRGELEQSGQYAKATKPA